MASRLPQEEEKGRIYMEQRILSFPIVHRAPVFPPRINWNLQQQKDPVEAAFQPPREPDCEFPAGYESPQNQDSNQLIHRQFSAEIRGPNTSQTSSWANSLQNFPSSWHLILTIIRIPTCCRNQNSRAYQAGSPFLPWVCIRTTCRKYKKGTYSLDGTI